jgi:dihydropyrimidinase
MIPFDLVIKGGDVILPGRGRTVCDIAIHGGKIAAILAPGEAVPAQEEMPAHGLVVMPGAVDVHLHLGHGKDIARPREPLDADRETAAAAKGGVTTFIPYLMATEPFEAIFDDVVAVTEQGARIDFGYHFIIATEAQLAGVARYVRDCGAPSFKIFMNNRGGEGARLCWISTTAFCSGCARPRPKMAAWSVRIQKRSKSPGCCATG